MTITRNHLSGFTLTELMVVVAVAGILMMIAIPSFTSLSESQRVKNASFDIYALFNIARSEAVKRNTNVSIAPVMVSGTFDRIDVTVVADGTLIHSKSAPKRVGIEVLAADGVTSLSGITYQRTGRVTSPGAGATFEIDVEGAATPTEHVRCITLGLSGIPQTRRGAC